MVKVEKYAETLQYIADIISGETEQMSVLANVSAALKMAFPEEYFWVGFYLVKNGKLVLGPFQGTVACYRIKRGRGVCGTAWEKAESIVVPDVEQFPGHIACSSLSRSEIVVPIFNQNHDVTGVIDIDSTEIGTFDDVDREWLEKVAELLGRF